MISFTSGMPQAESFNVELERLSALVADMEAIGRGTLPEELAGSETPVLDRWLRAAQFAPCLVGESTGHPLLPGRNRRIYTSELLLIDADHGWARTRSRWYRLGRPDGQAGFNA